MGIEVNILVNKTGNSIEMEKYHLINFVLFSDSTSYSHSRKFHSIPFQYPSFAYPQSLPRYETTFISNGVIQLVTKTRNGELFLSPFLGPTTNPPPRDRPTLNMEM